jgi:Ca-activated chloride channel family protein
MNWSVHFEDPLYFLLFLLPAGIILWKIFRGRRQEAHILLSHISGLENLPTGFRVSTRWIPLALRILGLSVLIVAMARPKGFIGSREVKAEGIDIMLAIDISTSMMAKDLKANRLDAAKKTAADFIKNRPDDRIGLVIFSGESFTQCPLTTDHTVLLELLDQLKPGMLEDGTAIGDGLSTAVARLKNSDAKSKVVILLTDGVNNKGVIYPLTAGELAKTFGIRVYTIGVGTTGKAESPVAIYPNGVYAYDMVEVKIDEPTLKQIAEMTGGRYFRATDNAKLDHIYKEIDELEKSIVKVIEYRKEPDLYFPFLLAGLLIIGLELILRMFVYNTLP